MNRADLIYPKEDKEPKEREDNSCIKQWMDMGLSYEEARQVCGKQKSEERAPKLGGNVGR